MRPFRIRLRRYPHRYVRSDRILSCDDARSRAPEGESARLDQKWVTPVREAQVFMSFEDLSKKLSQGPHKWYETTWARYEVVHSDGHVELLDKFLMQFREGYPAPSEGSVGFWRALRDIPSTSPNILEAHRLIRNPEPQRQDSVSDQLETVLALAVRAGCYDAEDLIRNSLKDPS